jgi:hypothetical protein
LEIQKIGNEMFLKNKNYEKKFPHVPYQTLTLEFEV